MIQTVGVIGDGSVVVGDALDGSVSRYTVAPLALAQPPSGKRPAPVLPPATPLEVGAVPVAVLRVGQQLGRDGLAGAGQFADGFVPPPVEVVPDGGASVAVMVPMFSTSDSCPLRSRTATAFPAAPTI